MGVTNPISLDFRWPQVWDFGPLGVFLGAGRRVLGDFVNLGRLPGPKLAKKSPTRIQGLGS